ncbi:ABC transporter permease [Kitasatospora acidiphila]|uniref:ABC transporter permease n=1 Tax=Kitasatospora acidiphila TaxID=2567942 RepID=UPI001C67D5BB|nr:FtsX-like permease family protein [Kitasatospora acidiphila]
MPPGHPPYQGGLVTCEQLASTPAFHGCEPGAQTATVAASFGDAVDGEVNWPQQWPTSTVPAAQVDKLPVLGVLVGTNGSRAAVEQVRTLLENTYPGRLYAPWTLAEFRDQQQSRVSAYQRLANAVMLVSLMVAGCSLAVGVAGGLSERKRPFSLLRLTGVQLRMLRRTVLLESALPLLVVSAVAIGMGFLAADLFLEAQVGYSVEAPSASYYVLVVAGLVASLGVIGSTLPLLKRITGPEAARND